MIDDLVTRGITEPYRTFRPDSIVISDLKTAHRRALVSYKR
jgi:hypothetical protein